jgi:putative DNA primase/helicase
MTLIEHHLTELEKASSIAPEVIEARGYRTVERPAGITSNGVYDTEWLKDLGFARTARDRDNPHLWPMLWIPTYRPTGEATGNGQIKPRNPLKKDGGRELKYVSPTGKAVQLDVHPFHRDKSVDPLVPLWIVEGVKKADCLTSHLEGGPRNGPMVVAIPGVYNWRTRTQALGDWEDIVLRGREVFICFDADARRNRMVAEAMRRFGNWLRSKGAAKVTYVLPPTEVRGKEVKGVDDFVTAGGSLADLEYSKRPPDPALDNAFSDRALAERAVEERFRDRFAWTPSSGWMEWTGVVWAETDDVRFRESLGQWFADQAGKALTDLQRGQGNPDDVKGWQSTLQYGKVRAVSLVMQGILFEDLADFDSDPDLLNCANGVVDLRTGKLMDHDPAFRMTKVAGAAYNPDATHSDWWKALEALPADVLEWFQTRMGQAITGHRPESDQVIFLYANGNNGKSTVIDLTTAAAGDYATPVSETVLLAAGKDAARASATPELMCLRGARYAYLEETPEAGRLNSGRLKKLTGTRYVTARPLYKDMVVFPAGHTLFVSSNFRLLVDQGDFGTWRRLLQLTFPYTYLPAEKIKDPESERVADVGFRDRVVGEQVVIEAVLAWMVAGAQRSYSGLGEVPGRIVADSAGWRQESDPVLRFVAENLVYEPGYWVESMEVYRAFNERMEAEGSRPMSMIKFGDRFLGLDSSRQADVQKIKSRVSRVSNVAGNQSTRSITKASTAIVSAWTNVRFVDPVAFAGDCPDSPEG